MTIEERLETLEKELKKTKHQNRYLLGALALFMGVGIFGVARSEQGKEVRTNKLIIEDEEGKTRAVLGMKKDNPGLVEYDDNGKPRMILSLDKMGPSVAFFDEKGNPRIGIGLANGDPALNVIDENGGITWKAP